MHRQSVAFIPSRICASVGFGIFVRSATALMIWPFWQKPHCGTCSSIHARCTGCSVPSLASPSSVVISPLTAEHGVTHERIAAPFMITAQAPHWPRPQPNRGPWSPRSLRRIYSSGVEGSISSVCVVPLTFKVTLLMPASPYEHHIERRDRKARREEIPRVLSVLCELCVNTSCVSQSLQLARDER